MAADSSVRIRPLGDRDISSLATLHVEAFPRSALTRLGNEAIRRYYHWLLHGPHQAACEGAFVNTQLVGFLFAGTFNGALSGFLHTNRVYLTLRSVTHPWMMLSPLFRDRIRLALHVLTKRRSASAPPCASVPKEPAYGVLALAVAPSQQRKGIGAALMEVAEDIAQREGFQVLELTVAAWNDRAINFYLSHGWKKVEDAQGWSGAMRKVVP